MNSIPFLGFLKDNGYIEDVTLKNNTQTKKRMVVGTYFQSQNSDLKVAMAVWGDLTENPALEVGKTVNVEFKINSREFDNRYYTDITLTKIL